MKWMKKNLNLRTTTLMFVKQICLRLFDLRFTKLLCKPIVLGNIKEIARELLQLQEKAQYKQGHPPHIQKGLSPLQSQRLVQRLYDKDNRVKDKIEQQQIQKLEEEEKNIAQQRPKKIMNENSAKILNQMKLKSFLERQEELQQQKITKLSQQRKYYEEMKKMEEEQVIRTRKVRDPRTIDKFIRDHEDWITHRKQNHQRIQFEVLSKESEALTFKPHINNNTRSILQRKSKSPTFHQETTPRNAKLSLTPNRDFKPFTPRINDRSRLLASRSKSKLPYADNSVLASPLMRSRNKSQYMI